MAPNPTRFGLIRFKNIAFSYPTRRGVNVLEDLNLDVNLGGNEAVVYVLFLLWGARCFIAY